MVTSPEEAFPLDLQSMGGAEALCLGRAAVVCSNSDPPNVVDSSLVLRYARCLLRL